MRKFIRFENLKLESNSVQEQRMTKPGHVKLENSFQETILLRVPIRKLKANFHFKFPMTQYNMIYLMLEINTKCNCENKHSTLVKHFSLHSCMLRKDPVVVSFSEGAQRSSKVKLY